jgi:hypothetical protein
VDNDGFRYPFSYLSLMSRSAFQLFSLHFRSASSDAARAAPRTIKSVWTGFCRTAGILAVAASLAACSPTYDWRTIMNNDNGYTVDMPAKPSVDERQIDVAGTPMKMAMQTAEADDAVFAVGTVMLPSDDPQTQRTALEFLRAGLARNLGAAPDAHPASIPLAAGGAVAGIEMTFSGKAGPKQEPRTMHARLVAKGRHVYQAAVIAGKELPPEQLDQFFQSFKLY